MAERSAKGNGSVRQRPDGKWEARCSINGKRRSFYGEKQADALKAMREAQKSADDKTYCDPTKMTFGEWLDIWLEEYEKPTLKRSSYETLCKGVNLHIKPALGNIRLQELNATQIQKLYNNLLKRMSPRTVKSWINSSILAALNKAVKCNYISRNPAEGCTIPKREKRKISPFTKAEVAVFLQKIEGEKFKSLFITALFTGMREGELLGLSWKSVDFQNNTITVEQQVRGVSRGRKDYYIETPKSGKERTIYPPAIVMDTLKDVRREQLLNKIHAGNEWKNDWDLVFTNEVGEVLAVMTVIRRFKNIAQSMNRPDMRFHDLRHTYAVMALQSGIDVKTVQNALGHHTAAFTLEVYTHVTEDMNKNSANRMQEYYKQLNA